MVIGYSLPAFKLTGVVYISTLGVSPNFKDVSSQMRILCCDWEHYRNFIMAILFTVDDSWFGILHGFHGSDVFVRYELRNALKCRGVDRVKHHYPYKSVWGQCSVWKMVISARLYMYKHMEADIQL